MSSYYFKKCLFIIHNTDKNTLVSSPPGWWPQLHYRWVQIYLPVMSEDSEWGLDSVDPYRPDVQESLAPQTQNCKWTDYNMTLTDGLETLQETWSSSSARDSLTDFGRDVELVCRMRKMQMYEGVCFPRAGLRGGLERWAEVEVLDEEGFETRGSELVWSWADDGQGSCSLSDICQVCLSVLRWNQGWSVEWLQS